MGRLIDMTVSMRPVESVFERMRYAAHLLYVMGALPESRYDDTLHVINAQEERASE